MKQIFSALILFSIPLLLMLQVLQGYRYTVSLENLERMEDLQRETLDNNRKILAGISVFDAPERIYQVAGETLGLSPVTPEQVIQVQFPQEAAQ